MKALIEKFIQNECSPEEREEVLEFLNAHPRALEDYFAEGEWNAFTVEETLPPAISARIRAFVYKQTSQPKTSLYKRLAWTAVAAATIAILLFVWQIQSPKNSNPDVATIAHTDAPMVDTINTTSTPFTIILPDSSMVVLYPQSRIRYVHNFMANRRTVQLIGEARFNVVKNSSRPFVVLTDSITTMVLGTIFTVAAYDSRQNISVKLQEGKLVVKKMAGSSAGTKERYFLSPGDELNYNRETNAVSIMRARVTPTGSIGKKQVPGDSQNDTNNWYQFNNQNLATVFDQVMAIYDVQINYNKADLAGLNYIGRIERNDPISLVLNDITRLNGLSLTQHNNTYTIRKKP